MLFELREEMLQYCRIENFDFSYQQCAWVAEARKGLAVVRIMIGMFRLFSDLVTLVYRN